MSARVVQGFTAFVLVVTLVLVSIWAISQMQPSVSLPTLHQPFSGSNSTSVSVGTAASASAYHPVPVDDLEGVDDVKYVSDEGSLEITYTTTSPFSCDVYVEGNKLGKLTGTSPQTFDNVSAAWIIGKNPVNVTYAGYNVTISKSALTLNSNPTWYQLSQAQGQTWTGVSSGLQLVAILPIILAASLILFVIIKYLGGL